MVLDQGGLFNDVKSIVWVFNTRDGFHTTTAEVWEASNSTALADDEDAITLHTYLRSIANMRGLLFTVFVASAAWASIHHPTECSILKNSARRSLIEGSQEEEEVVEETHGAAGTVPSEGYQELQYAPELQQNYRGRGGTARQLAHLDDESEATVNGLGSDDDEVIVFMPAEEMIIPDGPKRSMLCVLLLGNHRMAKRVNDFAEEHKAWEQIPGIIGFIVGMFALTEVIPLDLAWLGALAIPDTARCFFKLNVQAVKLCIREPFDFQVPFVTLTLALVGFMASFGFHPGCCAVAISFGLLYVTQILFGEYRLVIST